MGYAINKNGGWRAVTPDMELTWRAAAISGETIISGGTIPFSLCKYS